MAISDITPLQLIALLLWKRLNWERERERRKEEECRAKDGRTTAVSHIIIAGSHDHLCDDDDVNREGKRRSEGW